MSIWLTALDQAHGAFAEIVVRQPSFISGRPRCSPTNRSGVARLAALADHPRDAAYLSQDFVEANFDFYGRTFTAPPSCVPAGSAASRSSRARSAKLSAASTSSGISRRRPAKRDGRLVANLVEAYRQSIEELDWMGGRDPQAGPDKLDKFTPKIGYPMSWRDYSGLSIDPTDLIGNVRAAVDFELQRELNKIGKPLDRDEWCMTPQTINAYYNPRHQRNRVPGRRSCRIRSSIQDATPRPTTARSARSSATRSATASTTRARSTTAMATSPTGGRADRQALRKPGPSRSSSSTTPWLPGRFLTTTSTEHSRSARISATSGSRDRMEGLPDLVAANRRPSSTA